MMTAASIAAASAQGYADYLESQTVAPERGDYYLGTDGAPAEAAGRWLTPSEALARIGVEPGDLVSADLRALMEGRAPGSPADAPVWLRPAGADGTRAGGLDVTFSAPKPVSVVWAIGDPDQRAAIEAAHSRAVTRAVCYLRDRVPLSTGSAPARELHAAEFRHRTARGVAGAVPDPQLHSHVVVTSVERADGTVAAVRSRPAFRAAREVGAFYRAELAHRLRELGYETVSAGKDRRYFGIRGVSEPVNRAFSKRTDDVHRAAQRFQAQHGRDPERGELRSLALQTREAKTLRTRGELDGAWRATAASHELTEVPVTELADRRPDAWSARVVEHATERSAVFPERELRCVALEQAAGTGIAPERALADLGVLRENGQILELADGSLTTARMRALESQLEQEFGALAIRRGRAISREAVEHATCTTEERIGSSLTPEQRTALATLTGPERAAVLVGQAGTGKGVVIDTAAQAELAAGRSVVGVAVAGRTAQRLGEDAPAFAGRVRTLDRLVTAMENDRGDVDSGTTVYVDEAGMADTERLGRLVTAIDECGASLVLIGDSRQLASVGAGGMFERLQCLAPSAELTNIHRTVDVTEHRAWAALRSGDPALAMAHYRERGALHLSDSRAEAVDRAARRYLELAAEHGHDEVALMTDASNDEVDALNLRVQWLRLEAGELGHNAVEHAEHGVTMRARDRVAWSRSMAITGAARVENGVRGEVVGANGQNGSVRVRLDGSAREVEVATADADAVRLGYAGHIYRQQGATVERAVAVTGGWQTSREGAYVEASRARRGVEWHVARDELEGDDDAERIDHLAARMRIAGAQTRSLAHDLAGPPDVGPPGLEPSLDKTLNMPAPAGLDLAP